MRWSSFFGIIVGGAVLVLAARPLGLDEFVRRSIAAGRLLDWIMGALCFVWLLVILKVPWDLFFQAHAVTFEQQRSRERSIVIAPGREEYVRTLRQRLGWLAVGAHLASAALVAGVTFFSGGALGYYFAAFFLVSTLFRPAVAGYVFLTRKLAAIGEEVRYPRNDVAELRERLALQEQTIRALSEQTNEWPARLGGEVQAREEEDRDLRERLHALGREFETTVARLTDNREVIAGIQAFVRLVAQSSRPA